MRTFQLINNHQEFGFCAAADVAEFLAIMRAARELPFHEQVINDGYWCFR